jgi:5-methylcytosine-specific restriction endonuclease McrA
VNYEAYLKTAAWAAKAHAARRRAGYRCQVCNADGELHAHHRTYENLGDEKVGDITVLCVACHALYHDQTPTYSEADRAHAAAAELALVPRRGR